MKDLIQLGDIKIEVDRKAIKNVHLSVHPPDGMQPASPTRAIVRGKGPCNHANVC